MAVSTMSEYVAEIEHAVSTELPGVWHRHRDLVALQDELAKLTRQVQAEYEQASSIAMNAEDADDVMMSVGREMETYFGSDKERFAMAEEEAALKVKIEDQSVSVRALAESVLQHAKQGISAVYGGPIALPGTGRLIKSQHLSEVIWQGRNQAAHAGESSFHARTKAAMDQLAADFGNPWNEYTSRSMAFDLVELLGWREYSDFKTDMLTL